MKHDQNSCKDRFVSFMEKALDEIDAIDGDTPWSEREPEWRVKMMDIRASIQSGYQRHKR